MPRSDARIEFLADVIIGAVEGGTGYWAQVSAYRHTPADQAGVILHDIADDDAEDAPAYWVTLESIASAIQKLKSDDCGIRERQRRAILDASRENDFGMLDSDDADVIAQIACFGTVVYG